MEFNHLIVSIPATIALVIKGGVFFYAQRSKVGNGYTRLFLAFLGALTLLNIAELWHFHALHQGVLPYGALMLYYTAAIMIGALMMHLALALSFDWSATNRYRKHTALGAVYAYAAVLLTLLLFTPWLIRDFVPIGYTATRVPGPAYWLFEVYALACFLLVLGMLGHGARRLSTPSRRAKAGFMLLGIVPMAVVVIGVIVLQHFEARWLNASVIFPIAITYFLLVTTYAIYHHRLFEIQFFLPWSKLRKRKTAFYGRVRAMIAEIADLGSPQEVLNRLALTLHCPVALIGGGRPILAFAGAAHRMAQFPRAELQNVAHIVVANEIAHELPAVADTMQRHGVAAIVPFYPHSRQASGWLLLGDSFNEQVSSPLDFRVVEELFEKMADLFLDKLLAMRSQLSAATRQVHALQTQQKELETRLARIEHDNRALAELNSRLLKEQPADSLMPGAGGSGLPLTMTLLARDKAVREWLRHEFPQVQCYAGLASRGFRHHTFPDVLVWHLDEPVAPRALERDLPRLWAALRAGSAGVLFGPGTATLAANHRAALARVLVEVLPEGTTPEALARKIRALGRLRQALFSMHDPNEPLLGTSPEFARLMAEARRLSGFRDPVLLVYADRGQAAALAGYLHTTGHGGDFATLHAGTPPDEQRAALFGEAGLLARSAQGTLYVEDVTVLAPESQRELLAHARGSAGATMRLIAGQPAAGDPARIAPELIQATHPFTLNVPGLHQRRNDIGLLVHYFTLQFNLQADTHRYLAQSDVETLTSADGPVDVAGLRQDLFQRLQSQHGAAADEDAEPTADALEDRRARERRMNERRLDGKSLDDRVAEYEAGILRETLKRCDGNKSRAARLLGLRPNTLHYKLERYGLLENNKKE